MSSRLLLVEDERAIAEPLMRYLGNEGFMVDLASTAAEARLSMRQAPDLVILDWTLPDGQGIDLIRSWREAGQQVPVIFLTARHELIDKVLALELGADDYMTKPFEARELLARVKARLRQAPAGREEAPAKCPPLRHHRIGLDLSAHVATYDGTLVELTRMEFALLKHFMENVYRVFSRDEILNQVWGFDAFPTTRTVDTHVLQLRQKFAPEYFETVRGVGYRMAKEVFVQELTKN